MPSGNRGKVSAAISGILSSNVPVQAARCAACASRYIEMSATFLLAITISLCNELGGGQHQLDSDATDVG